MVTIQGMDQTTAPEAAPVRRIDWKAIEGEYRAGRKTIRAIAADYGVTHAAVHKRAKAEDWPRDISHRIAERAEAQVTKLALAEVDRSVTTASERQVIQANADLQARTIDESRKSVKQAAVVVDRLWARMDEAEAEGIDLASKVADRLTSALARLVDLRYKVMGIRDYRADEQPTTPNSPAEDEAWRALRDKVRQMGLLHEGGGNGG